VKDYPSYQSLQFDPSGRGGAFVGEGGPEDLVVLQPPLFQVRTPIGGGGVPHTAEKIAFVLKTALFHSPGAPAVNLGVKLIFSAPAPGQDAVAFLRSELIKGDDDFATLAGNMDFQVGIKAIFKGENVTHTLTIEPVQVDPKMLYLDLDSQFPGLVDDSRIASEVMLANDFMSTQVRNFLDARAESWSR
jgi:hypothetical protein